MPPPNAHAKTSDLRRLAIQKGYRSGLEEGEAARLTRLGVHYDYEAVKIGFTQPPKERKYTPDFRLRHAYERGHPGIYVETKGKFDADDRAKHLYVKACNPDLDIRFVFQNANSRITKSSPTTYAVWATKNGFQWAHKTIPEAWLAELGYT